MIFLKSEHSLNSRAHDAIATTKAKALAERLAEAKWPAAVLADERTMAGSLSFLAACSKKKILGCAGVQMSRLRAPGGEIAVVLFALDQTGLDRLVEVNHKVSNADTLNDVLAAFPKKVGLARDIVMMLLPGPRYNAATGRGFAELFADRGLGAVVGKADVNGEAVRHAPHDAADDLSLAAKLPLIAAPFAYAAADIPGHLSNALIMLGRRDKTYTGAIAAPQTFISAGIPDHDATRFEEKSGINAVKLFERASAATLERKPQLPRRAGLAEGEEADSKLRALVAHSAAGRIADERMPDTAAYRERLAFEVDLVVKLNFSNYFLMMDTAVRFARENGIPVGAGRGSAAGSLMAFSLGLTDIDPIKHKLFFERFINHERVSLPDIDTDFCMNRRGEVIAHMAKVYGDANVAQIATYGINQVKGALREAGRVLGLRGAADKAVQLIDARSRSKDNSDWEEILSADPDDDVGKIVELTRPLLGMAKNDGVHAGGLVISDGPICRSAPVSRHRSDVGRQVIEFDMKGTEACGLVKYDFLGLRTLTVIDGAVQALAAAGIKVDIAKIPDEDPEVFEMIRRGRTRTIFQIESGGMTSAATEIGVDKFEDIVALVALYRPGPMENIPLYAARKRGKAAIAYPHPVLEQILKDTYGVIIYQEQIMQIAQAWANYTLAEADILRRGIGKKDAAEVAAARQPFYDRSAANGRDPEITRKLFEFVEPFARYGFNKSHAAAYATISWQTAWLKCHHPGAWYASAATHEPISEKKAKIIAEAASRGIKIIDPGVNRSMKGFHWKATGDRQEIVLPMECVLGVGGPAADAVVDERQRSGAYTSMTDLMSRTSAFNRSQLEHLANAGVFDRLSPHPYTVSRPAFAAMARAGALVSAGRSKQAAQASLFGSGDLPMLFDPEPTAPPTTPEKATVLQQELLQGMMFHERRTIASAAWRRRLEQIHDLNRASIIARTMECSTMGILTETPQDRNQKAADGRQDRILSLRLEDETGVRRFDVAAGCAAGETLAGAVGRAVKIHLKPSDGVSLIHGAPTVVDAEVFPDPMEEPREHPVLVVDYEINEERRAEIQSALQALSDRDRVPVVRKRPEGSRPTRRSRGLSTTHLLVSPPSNRLEIFPLPVAARSADLATGLQAIAGFRSYLD